jgi:hypothetical protein
MDEKGIFLNYGKHASDMFLIEVTPSGEKVLVIDYWRERISMPLSNLELVPSEPYHRGPYGVSSFTFHFNNEVPSEIQLHFLMTRGGDIDETIFKLNIDNAFILERNYYDRRGDHEIMKNLCDALIAEANRQDAMRKGQNLSTLRQTMGNLRPNSSNSIPEELGVEHGPIANIASALTGKKGTPHQQMLQLREESTRIRGTQGVARRRKTRRKN